MESSFQVMVARTEFIRSRPLLGHAVAVLLAFGALWVRFALGSALNGYPLITWFPAVLLAAFLGGFWPGVTASVLGGFLAHRYLIAPDAPINALWPVGVVAILFFTINVSIIVGLTSGMLDALKRFRQSESALQSLNSELERRVAERTKALHAEMTERNRAETALRHLQKMEAIGQLTGGVAHDFNNMLSIVIGSLDMARRRLTGSELPQLPKLLENAAEGARRAATLTARLLAFSRQQPLEPAPVDINKLVAGMSDMLRRTLGEIIEVETVLSGGLWRTFVDAGELENALVNLAVNARDAMPNGGRLTIETANADLDDRYAMAYADVTPGQYVLVSITDTGTGMSAEVMERAFDPFYTTKDIGKGTGLGLSQVFGYVKQSRGHVKLYSEPGQGTTVKLYLPRFRGTDAPKPVPQAPAMQGGSRDITVLVVEDDAQVREMTAASVHELGYNVLVANDGAHALALLKAEAIDILFTDVVMPGLSGKELADRAWQERPALKVLFTTGYTRNAIVHNGVLDQGVALLTKPFTLPQLAAKLNEMCGG